MLALSFDGQVTTVSDLPARLVTRLDALRINRAGGLRPAVFAITNNGADYRSYLSIAWCVVEETDEQS